MLKILLALLPTVAFASINVNIRTGRTENEANVELLGSNIDIIPDDERNTWRLSDSQLKDAVRAYFGSRPDDAYLKSPTPWNDLYKSYGWRQVQRTLTPKSARILGIRSEPVIVNTQDFINNSSVKATYNAGITQQVEVTSTSTWSKGGSLSVGQKIEYKVGIEGVIGAGGSTSLSYTASWGQEVSESKKVTIGSSSGVQVDLEPGQSIVATLTATRGTMDIEVDYVATLSGHTAINYSKTYKGHHFWALDINSCLNAVGSPTSIDSTETIKIGFYSDAKVLLTDKKSSKVLLEARALVY